MGGRLQRRRPLAGARGIQMLERGDMANDGRYNIYVLDFVSFDPCCRGWLPGWSFHDPGYKYLRRTNRPSLTFPGKSLDRTGGLSLSQI